MNEYKYSDILIGQKEEFSVAITKEMEENFRLLTNDINPMHYDDQYAKTISKGKYDKHIVFGMLTASFLSTLAGVYLPGKFSLIHSVENIDFKSAVNIGDSLRIIGEVKDKIDSINLLKLDVKIFNQYNNVVLKSQMKIIVQK